MVGTPHNSDDVKALAHRRMVRVPAPWPLHQSFELCCLQWCVMQLELLSVTGSHAYDWRSDTTCAPCYHHTSYLHPASFQCGDGRLKIAPHPRSLCIFGRAFARPHAGRGNASLPRRSREELARRFARCLGCGGHCTKCCVVALRRLE